MIQYRESPLPSVEQKNTPPTEEPPRLDPKGGRRRGWRAEGRGDLLGRKKGTEESFG